MEPILTIGSTIKCSMAVPPGTSVLVGTSPVPLLVANMPAATIINNIPLMNIMTFGLCNAKANPVVIAATAAALGTPTPAPCVPATASPWSPAAQNTKVYGVAVALKTSKCRCMWGGSISVVQTAGTPHKTA